MSQVDAGRGSVVRRGLLVIVAVLALLAAGAVGVAAAGPPPPADDSADAGFARDMQVHHAQAVQMALIVREKSKDPVLRSIAYDIATAQQQQVGQMYGWLVQWGLPQASSEPSMAWMSDDEDDSMGSMGGMPMGEPSPAAGGPMPGMASAADLQRLRDASGRTAEVLFLRLMVAHHRGGVTMAQAAVDRADREEVVGLAKTIVGVQTAEIEQLQTLLADRGQPPA